MKSRRSLFKGLIGLIIAPRVIDTLPPEIPIIRSGPRRLKINWSFELEQDLIALHGLNVDSTLVCMSNAIQCEIDNNLINNRS